MAYCTTDEYHVKYPYCDLTDTALAEWLEDAATLLAPIFAEADVDVADLTDEATDLCKRITRDMVHRAIGDGASYMNGFQGSTQFFTTGEDYSQTVNMGNGFADLYIRKNERAALLAQLRADGLTEYGGTRAACAAPSFGVFDGE